MLYRASLIFAMVSIAFVCSSPAAAGSASAAMMGSGAAWIDYDNDGDLDLFYMTGKGEMFFHNYNKATDTFTDVTNDVLPQAVVITDQWSVGVACSDLNNDGWMDMFLAMDGPNILLLNDNGVFTQRAGKPPGNDFSASVAVFDYNRDSLPDIFVGNYLIVGTEDNAPNQLLRCDSIDEEGVPHYTDVAADLGMQGNQRGDFDRTLGLAVADFNDDGWSDIYVANDFDGIHEDIRPGWNEMFFNNGDGTFSNVTDAMGVRDNEDAMGVVAADYDDDGDMDIFVANFWEDALFRNDNVAGGGSFTLVTEAAGLYTGRDCEDDPDTWSYNGWGTALFDYDNDGDKDLHIANGYIISDQVPEEPNQLFENMGNGQFYEVGCAAGLGDVGDARGSAYGDFNEDGLIDIIVINNNWLISEEYVDARTRLLQINQGDGTFKDEAWLRGLREEIADAPKPPARKPANENHWIQIELTGRGVPNYSSVSCEGARVWVTAGGKTQVQDLGAYSYCSANSMRMHFGLGSAETIDKILVRYPSGIFDLKEGVAVDQILHLTEPMITPVRLLSFRAASKSEGVELQWTYEDDLDVLTFEVHRSEALGSQKIAEIEPEAYSLTYLDAQAPEGDLTYTLYARLRSGSRNLIGSKSLSHSFTGTPRLAVRPGFPNPFTDALSIPLTASTPSKAHIGIYDAQGRLVRELHGVVNQGGSVLQWDGLDGKGAKVPAGVYFYKLAGSAGQAQRVIRIK